MKSKLIKIVGLCFILLSCNENPPKLDSQIIATVNGNSLTVQQLSVLKKNDLNNGKFEKEIVQDWIKAQLIISEAKEENLFSSDEYKLLLQKTKSDLALGQLLNNYFDKNLDNPKETELKQFYELNNKVFRLKNSASVINYSLFKNESDAINFRKSLNDHVWDSELRKISKDSLVTETKSNFLLRRNDFRFVSLINYFQKLNVGEASVVIPFEKYFLVAQLIKHLKKDEIPELFLIKNNVEDLYLAKKRKKLYSLFISELYLKNDVNILEKYK